VFDKHKFNSKSQSLFQRLDYSSFLTINAPATTITTSTLNTNATKLQLILIQLVKLILLLFLLISL